MKKAIGLVVLVCFAVLARSQEGSQPKVSDDFLRTPPQISVVISEHKTGADMVEITMSDPNYPEELLESQCVALGQLTGGGARGLFVQAQVFGGNSKLRFVKAKFATDGLLEPKSGIVRLTPIVQAFAGAAAPFETRSFSILVSGIRPKPNTIAKFGSDGILVIGIPDRSGSGLEYRVLLLSQDPKMIVVPDQVEKRPVITKRNEPQRPSNVLVWVFLGVGAIAAGVLVYSLALRLGSK